MLQRKHQQQNQWKHLSASIVIFLIVCSAYQLAESSSPGRVKRMTAFRSDLGRKRSLDTLLDSGDDDGRLQTVENENDVNVERRASAFRSDLGKRLQAFRSDLGKRSSSSFRSDLGKRPMSAFRSDLGKRADERMPFQSESSNKRHAFRSDLGRRSAFRSDLGKRNDDGEEGLQKKAMAAFRSDLGKRPVAFRSDLG